MPSSAEKFTNGDPWTSRVEVAGEDMVAIPFPADLIASLGWKEGDVVAVDIVDGRLTITRGGGTHAG